MPSFLSITSRENAVVKSVCALQSSARERRKTGLFILEGLRICDDAFANNIPFEKLIVSKTAEEKYTDTVARFAENAATCISVPDSLFAKMSDTDSPQGILAVAAVPQVNQQPDPKGRYIGLENINDPSNLGAVARTAEALGVSGIFVTGDGCDPYSPKALRASMGTLLRVPLFVVKNLIDTANAINLKTFACVVDADAEAITKAVFSDGVMLMIGNEANGLKSDTKVRADYRVTIPMHGKAESLNAAAAAAIAMWEMVR